MAYSVASGDLPERRIMFSIQRSESGVVCSLHGKAGDKSNNLQTSVQRCCIRWTPSKSLFGTLPKRQLVYPLQQPFYIPPINH
ncbi:Uncharacterized protein APZ42_001867 [Daphnia magna]|uniref:Uncharacterized protein n=1 Tax=Daphnia magna TaxID=35525 RepID=A0A164IP51_9CRUS|nr:Uncharacterized protein APZ42_001867 [Daphnia magna]